MPKKVTVEMFIERAKKIHGDKYDYSKVNYTTTRDKVLIKCNECGNDFWQGPSYHLSGHGCPICGRKRAGEKHKLTIDEFIAKARKIHGDRFDYSKSVYTGYHNKMYIIDKETGCGFWQAPENHLRNTVPKYKYDKNEKIASFVRKAQALYGSQFDYSRCNFASMRKETLFKCNRCGKDFYQTPENHLNGYGCPNCDSGSYYEIYLYNFLIQHFDKKDILREYNKDSRYPFHCDFYIKSRDMFIEINGHLSHGPYWFDNSLDYNLELLRQWLLSGKEIYNHAAIVWTVNDVRKRRCAQQNDLNYVVLWNIEDIDKWVNDGFPDRKDWNYDKSLERYSIPLLRSREHSHEKISCGDIIGQNLISKQGDRCVVINAYKERYNCGTLTVFVDLQFDDGTIVKHRKWANAKRGMIDRPVESKYLGKKFGLNSGLMCTIINVYHGNDKNKSLKCDIQFEDGIVVKNKSLSQIKSGHVAHP